MVIPVGNGGPSQELLRIRRRRRRVRGVRPRTGSVRPADRRSGMACDGRAGAACTHAWRRRASHPSCPPARSPAAGRRVGRRRTAVSTRPRSMRSWSASATAGRADRRGHARHVRVLPDARADHPRADRAARVSPSSRSKPTGRMRRSSTITSAVVRPSVRRSDPFDRFPTWMWRNREVSDFVDWLRDYNDGIARPERAGRLPRPRPLQPVHVDRRRARATSTSRSRRGRVARERYGCLTPWQRIRPPTVGPSCRRAFGGCEDGSRRRCSPTCSAGASTTGATTATDFLDAVQNARLVADAERYYRVMYHGARRVVEPARPPHVRDARGPSWPTAGDRTTGVVWEHNSHVGDAAATEMGARGEHNVGMLARRASATTPS